MCAGERWKVNYELPLSLPFGIFYYFYFNGSITEALIKCISFKASVLGAC